MTEAEPPPRGLPVAKRRLPFEEKPLGGAVQTGQRYLYAVLAVGLSAVALYMALVLRHPLTSPYVAAPGIGALWFGLRTFMVWGSRG